MSSYGQHSPTVKALYFEAPPDSLGQAEVGFDVVGGGIYFKSGAGVISMLGLNQVDLASEVTGVLPSANIDQDLTLATLGLTGTLTLDTPLSDTAAVVVQRTGAAIGSHWAYNDTATAIDFGTTTAHELRMLYNSAEVAQFNGTGLVMNSGSAIQLSNNYNLQWGGANTLIYGHNTNGINILSQGATRVKITDGGEVCIGATASASNAQLYSVKTYSAASGTDIGAYFTPKQSVATTGGLRGLQVSTDALHTVGTVAEIVGLFGDVLTTGSGGTTTNAYGVRARVRASHASSTITNGFGLYVDAFTATGTFTNRWGVYQAGASETNFFGGDVRIGTTIGATHTEDVLRVYGSNARLVNVHSTGGDSRIHFSTDTTGSGGAAGLNVGIENNTDALLWNYGSGHMRFGTNNTERMRLAALSATLTVGGASNIASFHQYEAHRAGDSYFAGVNTNAGAVGNGNYFTGYAKDTGGTMRQQGLLGFQTDVAHATAPGTRFQLHLMPTGGGVREVLRVNQAGALLVGETENVNQTVGIALNQGANDDEIFALKSSDVAHGMTALTETDTFGTFSKNDADAGGLKVTGYRDTGVEYGLGLWGVVGAAGSTTKSTSGKGIVHVVAAIKSGTGVTPPGADENLFAVAAYSTTAFIVDAEGDLHANAGTTTTAVTVFDEFDDAALCRFYDTSRANAGAKGLIQREFGEWSEDHEEALIDIGILGAPLTEGGMTNFTRLVQLHNGAIVQASDRIAQLEADRAEDRKLRASDRKLITSLQKQLAQA